MIFRLLRPRPERYASAQLWPAQRGIWTPAAAANAAIPLLACACTREEPAPPLLLGLWQRLFVVSFLLAVPHQIDEPAVLHRRSPWATARRQLRHCRLISPDAKASVTFLPNVVAHRCSVAPPPPPSRSTNRSLPAIESAAPATFALFDFVNQLSHRGRAISPTCRRKAWLSGHRWPHDAAVRRFFLLMPGRCHLGFVMLPALLYLMVKAYLLGMVWACYKFLLRKEAGHLRSVRRGLGEFDAEDDDMDSETATDPHLLMMHPPVPPVPPKYEDALKQPANLNAHRAYFPGSYYRQAPPMRSASWSSSYRNQKGCFSYTERRLEDLLGIALLLLLIFFFIRYGTANLTSRARRTRSARETTATRRRSLANSAWLTAARYCGLRLFVATALPRAANYFRLWFATVGLEFAGPSKGQKRSIKAKDLTVRNSQLSHIQRPALSVSNRILIVIGLVAGLYNAVPNMGLLAKHFCVRSQATRDRLGQRSKLCCRQSDDSLRAAVLRWPTHRRNSGPVRLCWLRRTSTDDVKLASSSNALLPSFCTAVASWASSCCRVTSGAATKSPLARRAPGDQSCCSGLGSACPFLLNGLTGLGSAPERSQAQERVGQSARQARAGQARAGQMKRVDQKSEPAPAQRVCSPKNPCTDQHHDDRHLSLDDLI
uniref:RING-type domain-containing protein n=1 Tax=Macrostomum lignano TaxID=282301 RepID=A0A1I8F5S7_9PLAT